MNTKPVHSCAAGLGVRKKQGPSGKCRLRVRLTRKQFSKFATRNPDSLWKLLVNAQQWAGSAKNIWNGLSRKQFCKHETDKCSNLRLIGYSGPLSLERQQQWFKSPRSATSPKVLTFASWLFNNELLLPGKNNRRGFVCPRSTQWSVLEWKAFGCLDLIAPKLDCLRRMIYRSLIVSRLLLFLVVDNEFWI